MNSNWFHDLFVKEAKSALKKNVPITDEQVTSAVNAYLEKNPVEAATAKIENGILKVT